LDAARRRRHECEQQGFNRPDAIRHRLAMSTELGAGQQVNESYLNLQYDVRYDDQTTTSFIRRHFNYAKHSHHLLL
jgi:hypothetical protein